MRIKYCDQKFDAKGRKYYVFNPRNVMMKKALGIGSQRFNHAEQAKRFVSEVSKKWELHCRISENKVEVDEQTLQGLWHYYRTTKFWSQIKPNSKRNYIDTVNATFSIRVGNQKELGNYYYRNIDRPYIDKLTQEIISQKSYHRAYHTIKFLKMLLNVGIEHKKLTNNPFNSVKLAPPPDRKVIWKSGELDSFIKVADELDKSSIGTIALFCFYLGQRPGDIRQLKNMDFTRGNLKFTQEKSVSYRHNEPVSMKFDLGSEALVALQNRINFVREKELKIKDRLDNGEILYTKMDLNSPATNLRGVHRRYCTVSDDPLACLINLETTGQGLSKDAVSKNFAQVRERAGLLEGVHTIELAVQMRDLLATRLTQLGSAGCALQEIMAVSGHTRPSTVMKYLRDKQTFQENAFKRLAANG